MPKFNSVVHTMYNDPCSLITPTYFRHILCFICFNHCTSCCHNKCFYESQINVPLCFQLISSLSAVIHSTQTGIFFTRSLPFMSPTDSFLINNALLNVPKLFSLLIIPLAFPWLKGFIWSLARFHSCLFLIFYLFKRMSGRGRCYHSSPLTASVTHN